jgi:glycine/D-amino acid oxidase-like deaminating enzyme
MNLTTGYPYSLISHGLPANYPKLEKGLKTDVVIIGGGISGALTAYYLVNAGIECVLVDARTIGLGSTCASTSLLQYELDKPLSQLSKQIGNHDAALIYRLCSESIDSLEAISSTLKFDHFERQPSLFFAADAKDVKFLESEYDFRKKAGFEVDLLSQQDIKHQFGFNAPAAILSAQGATVDAYMLTHALLQYSQKKGLQVFDRTRVSKIRYQKKGAILKTESGFSITAGKIVNATGYEVTEFIDKKIVNLHSTYAIASEHLSAGTNPWKQKAMLWNTADPYLYMRLTADHRIMIGGRDEKFYSPAKRDKLIGRKSKLLKRDFEKLFPAQDFIPELSWSGTFGTTTDSLPYIGQYAPTPHTYYALGFGGNGITFSVMAAEIIRDLLLGRKDSKQELFSFSRKQ